MASVTRFPTRASTAERMGDFTRHLRHNGFRVGVQETEMGLHSLESIDLQDTQDVRMALKAICCADTHSFERFDDLFNAFWLNRSVMRTQHEKSDIRKP
ncbi:MAG: carbon monoxide dehydrogenase, partial [SAR116 cluster bacterium]|nr:carbon monoxide dehydrogenase [SAR116 cluster bacterium]